MTASTLEDLAGEVMRCPTCGARQEWSDECRRCKCDLLLLRQAQQTCQRLRASCLNQLRAGRIHQAIPLAERYVSIQADDRSKRLLAVCYVLAGHWQQAVRIAHQIGD